MSGLNQLQSIRIIILWFGAWPAYMRPFIESCRWNPTIDWLIYGDAPPPDDLPPNLKIITISFEEYREIVASRLGINIRWVDAYKLCDVKPALGFIHEHDVHGYDYWGYGDLDVVYGDIRRFYGPQVLSHDIISTHATRAGGHFLLVRNTPKLATAFRRIPRWKSLLTSPQHKAFDERYFSRLFLHLRGKRAILRLFTPYLGGGYFEEQFSTEISSKIAWIDGSYNWPQQWFWDRGRLTTNRSGGQEFLYLHFTSWHSNRWIANGTAPWKALDCLVKLPNERPTGFTISANGFTPLPQTSLGRGGIDLTVS